MEPRKLVPPALGGVAPVPRGDAAPLGVAADDELRLIALDEEEPSSAFFDPQGTTFSGRDARGLGEPERPCVAATYVPFACMQREGEVVIQLIHQ